MKHVSNEGNTYATLIDHIDQLPADLVTRNFNVFLSDAVVDPALGQKLHDQLIAIAVFGIQLRQSFLWKTCLRMKLCIQNQLRRMAL